MKFGILGPLAVSRDGEELELGAAKQRALLAVMLLHAGETMPTERLVDALWGEHPPATAVKALQVYVSQLRKTLGDGVVETRPLGYVVRVEDGALDLQRFESLLGEGRRLLGEGNPQQAGEVLREALALWRGEPLADFRYEAFAANAIGRLDELRLIALEHRLEADLAVGDNAEAVPELEALVREYPLRESLRGLLMRALYRSGRQADALAVMQDARVTLRDELGLDPGQPLQQLEKAILLQDPSLDSGAVAPPTAPAAPIRPAVPALVCEVCGTANGPGAAFCRSCGAPLRPEPAPETRKTVTVLFCDVVAYTELAGRLDPEALRHVMLRFFELAAGAIERHGGTVEKFVGDEVMAVFGVPVVREDDVLRAVRAALEVRELVPALESERGAKLEVRIGVNTGEVVAGDASAGHGFVTGEAVALGKRLQQSAGVGEVLLGEETYALVAHAVEVTPLAPLDVKGKQGGVKAFRLESIVADAPALARRDDAPLVGRERELEWLAGLWAEVCAGAGTRQVTIVGEPGIGKSRLGREFVAGRADEARVLVGRCPPYGEGITFLPLHELLGQAGRDEELLGSTREVFAAARRILEELAAERPLIAVFDDVHWAEPTLLDFVEYLVGQLGDARVLVLCLARPQLAEQRPGWLQPPAKALAVEPLSQADAQRLLEELGAPAAARARIAEAAEGNPLFVEQLAAIAGEDAAAEMPASIRGVLHERLDRLPRGERAVLEVAAVVGRSFSLDAVLDLTPEESQDDVQARLLALARKRFVRPDPTAPEEGFRFHHALIRDAAYDGVPKSTRADLHERVAARLEALAAADALVGYHLEQSFVLRRDLGSPDPELGARAGRRLRAAGEEAFGRTDLPAAISLFERARALLPPDEADHLLPRLGQALFEAGRLSEADLVLEEAGQRGASDAVLAARVSVEQQFVKLRAEWVGAIGDARRAASEALRVFELQGDDFDRCRALCLHAWLEWIESRVGAADEAWRRAAVHARAAGEQRELFDILGWRGAAALWGPIPVDEAIETCTEILEEVRISPVALATTLHPLAALHAMRGEFDEARSLIREGVAIFYELDRLQSAGRGQQSAFIELLADNPAQAVEDLRSGYDRLEAMGEKAVLATTAAMLAGALYVDGRYDEADRYCTVSETTAAAEDLITQVLWRGVRGKLLARAGQVAEGEALAREAVQLVSSTDHVNHQGDALLDLAEVLRSAGKSDEAAAVVTDAAGRYERKGNVVSAERARSLLATVGAR